MRVSVRLTPCTPDGLSSQETAMASLLRDAAAALTAPAGSIVPHEVHPAQRGGLVIDLHDLSDPARLAPALRAAATLTGEALQVTVPGGHVRAGDFSVGSADRITGPLLVIHGDAQVYGTVVGNLTTVDGDIVLHSGGTVLGDVLAWGVSALRPAAAIDLATLTGSCVVALGPTTAGAFGPGGKAMEAVLAAARAAGEDVWRMPLTESLKEQLKSEVADLKNAGERWGGAISAAWFLKEFVGDTPWVHLDIAGPASTSKERGYLAKGATAAGLRTLVELVRGWQG